MAKEKAFCEPMKVFQERWLPEEALPVGYAALIEAYQLKVPLPRKLSAIGARHKIYEKMGWKIYTPRHCPKSSFEGHLYFALKYEGIDLAILKNLFCNINLEELEEMINHHPTSTYARRIWFLYEWLFGKVLNLPDAKKGIYVEVVDSKIQWAIKGKTSSRHRVYNNLPGPKDFCPLIFRTSKIENFIKLNLAEEARKVIGDVSADILSRTAAFLLLKDSKSSYAIEGENPPQSRIQRWGRAIGEAGKNAIDLDELLRLQRVVIGEERFIKLGLRSSGGFVGEHERGSRFPLPVHISARPEDLKSLIEGIVSFDRKYAIKMDSVMAAAILAFGFVYIHPFEDGNGRLHRYLIHHVLAERGFCPLGVIYPVSAVILERIEDYRKTLESYSKRLLPIIEWKPTEDMNIEVLNETGDFYRYFDATPHVEFLYECVKQTVKSDLPNEVEFLKLYDLFKDRVETYIEMPDDLINLLFHFLKQNQGSLSKRGKTKEFSMLKQNEVENIEGIYQDVFLKKDKL